LAALASVRAEKDPVAWLQSRLKAEMVEDSEILAIRLQDVAPEDARILLRAIVESYLTQVVHRDRDLSQDRLFRLKEIQLTLQNAVKNKKSNLRQLAEALMRAFRDETEVQFMFCRC
jgi:hypothetical protein